MTLEENKDLVKHYIEFVVQGHARGDLEQMSDYLTPDVVLHTPVVSDHPEHGTRIHEESRTYGTALPELELVVEQIVAEGDLVAVHLSARGTHDGPFRRGDEAHAPTGGAVDAGALAMYRVRDNKIAEIWYYSTLADRIQASSRS
jgi:ketosteroid isomerase-like protein